MLALSAIASEQANTTNATMKKVKKFLNYAASHQDEIVMYHVSYMVLIFHINASYLSELKARIQVGGNFSYQIMTKPQETMGKY